VAASGSAKGKLTNSQYQQLKKEISKAHNRCEDIADGERLLGYDDTAELYDDIADEMLGLVNWLTQFMPIPFRDPFNQQ
jgi:hypothetical protein